MSAPDRRIAFDAADAAWSRDPVTHRLDGERLTVEAAEGSDWWHDTAYGFRHDDGHAL